MIRELPQERHCLYHGILFSRGNRQPDGSSSPAVWRDFYHVDGFHVLGEGFNREMLLRDGILSGAKLIFQGFDFDHFYRGKLPARRCGAESI